MLRDLLFLAAEHPAPEVRSRCSSLLRNCSDEVSARVLFGALMHAARSDEQSLRAVWTDDPQTDERNTSSVSGQTGALVLSLAAGFPDLSQEHTCAYALESLIECLWASRHGHTTTPEGQADPWSTTRPSLVSTRGFDKKSSRMAFEASTRAAIQQTAQAVRPFRLELFCALRRLAREPGGRGARIVSLALLKRWARQARLPDGGTDSGVEEAADLLHVVRDCLNPGDSIGLRWCVRALPSCVLEDRGSLATLLLLALKHESAHVRREAAQQCQLMPANHHAWAAAQLASALEKHRDVPFIDAVVGACPRLPPRPPGELLQLVLTCAQSGHQEARRLLQRSPIFEATVEMSKVQGESNWVLQSLPPLEAGCSSKLVRQLAGDESWLRHDVVRSACRRGDERVARHVVALLAACSDTGDGTVRLFEALPDFAFIADDSVEELFVLATSSHPTASYVQDLLREGTTELPSPSGPHCIDRRSPEGCKRRCAAVARLVMHNLPLVLQEDDVLQAGSLIGTLRSAPKTLLLEHASHPSVEDVLRLTWRSQSLGCRRAARDFFTLGSGTSQLLSYLSSHLLAYAKEHSDEFDALDEVFTEVECLGATQGAQPPTDGVTRVPKNSLQTHEIVRVLQMLPDDLTHAGSRLLETIVIYAMKHTDIVLKETCTDIVQGTCVAEVLDIVECYIDDDTMRVAAIRLLPKNIARATGRLLQKLLSVAMTHHDAAARCASQKVLRSNMNTTAALPLLMAKMLNGSADLPFDHIIGALLCLDGASLPSVLLQPLCSLLSHTSETVCTAAYDEVAKAPTAHPDVVRELMHIVTASLEPRLTAPPSSLVLSLNRALCLLLSWGLNQHVSELDVEKLLHITTKFASTPEGDLALAILRRTKKEYSKMCLRYLLQKHSVTEPRCIAVGLPELPDIGKNDGVNTWDYGRLLQAVVPAVLERGDDWAVALAKRSTVLSAVMGSRVKTAVHELPSADTMPTRREQALQHAARAMQALPDLESLRLACCSAPEAGRLIDAVCLIADGVGEEDVLAHLKEPARSLLLPAREVG